jgi:hypothetical protein
VADIAAHLFPVMHTTLWWNDDEHSRCLWSSAAAAEYLRRRRVRARAVFSAFSVDLIRAATASGRREDGIDVGLPDKSTGHPGLHSLVEISDRSGPWLLDMNIWQARRPRFPGLPNAVAVSKDYNIELSGYPDFKIAGVIPRSEHGHIVHLLVAPNRQQQWVGIGDMEPCRAKAAADGIEARVRAMAEAPPAGNESCFHPVR